ncbi:hypothetical protein PARHAE_01812 [Paracoccus haematequi]|uniref:Uncharacterized protein n=1 Tax=Paracoccus haematequi TaxID=2491866 RepID=A0A447IM86_9RHOB|nr:hypothetical protein PARHAE_01812 [Paracoccus haematequi]
MRAAQEVMTVGRFDYAAQALPAMMSPERPGTRG